MEHPDGQPVFYELSELSQNAHSSQVLRPYTISRRNRLPQFKIGDSRYDVFVEDSREGGGATTNAEDSRSRSPCFQKRRMQRYMLPSYGLPEQVSTAVCAKETGRARGQRESSLHGRVLVPARLYVPDRAELLRRASYRESRRTVPIARTNGRLVFKGKPLDALAAN